MEDTTRVEPLNAQAWLITLSAAALAVLFFPGFYQWDTAPLGLFALSSLFAGAGVSFILQSAREWPFYREYGLSSPHGSPGQVLPVHFHLRGGPLGCRVADLHWTLECRLVTSVEADYIEGITYRPTCATVHRSEGTLPAAARLMPGEEQRWLLPVPLPTDARPSYESGREDVEGTTTWRLTVAMRVKGQPGLSVAGTLQVLGPL